ncbi:MAG TPA: hypothetical protein ENL20_04135, partial [Candidatus Cloacimonetes bacterium]|nr:hypothetical protein [Candidatus Cloacimonadota bacterium]
MKRNSGWKKWNLIRMMLTGICRMNSYQEKIEKFLKDIRSKKIEVQEDKWYEFLKSELTFPFAAKIEDIDEFSKTDLEWNDIVNVKGIDN